MILLTVINPSNLSWEISFINLTHLFSEDHITIFHLAKHMWHCLNPLFKVIRKVY